MITFTQILACNGTVIYEVIGNQMNFFSSGKMQVLLAYDGMVLLKLNEFEYGINGSQTILYDQTDPQFALILYLKKYPKDQWIIKINENSDAVYSCLGQKCYLKSKKDKYKRQQAKVEEAKVEQVEKKGKKVVIQNTEEQQQKTENEGILIGASKQLNKGLKFTGNLLSKGFQSLGGFLSKKVEKKEQKEVSSNTKENLKLLKNTTSNVLTFTSQQVGNLFRFGKKVAADVGQRFQKSDKGKELQEHPYYETVKDGAKTGVGVIANIYDGVVGAVYAMGGGVAKGVTKVIGAKYGEDAETAADEAFEGAGNVVQVLRVPEDQAAKALK